MMWEDDPIDYSFVRVSHILPLPLSLRQRLARSLRKLATWLDNNEQL
jgi:hypothetical protein